MDARITALLAAASLCLGCTAVVKSRVGDPPDGSADAPGDVEPDFDPDSCGLWGQVFLESPDDINVDTEDPTLDGYGRMSAAVLSTDSSGDPVSAGTIIEDVDALNHAWYCVPRDVLAGVDSGFVDIIFIDTMSHWEAAQYNQFKSIVSDPLVPTLYLASVYDPGTDYTVYTDLYWDGTTNRFDIPLSVRTSRLAVEVTFEGFTTGSGRRARICAYAAGVRESGAFTFVAIGATSVDITDDDVSSGSYGPFYVNAAAEVGQQYKVLLYYIEGRELFDDSSPYFRCGSTLTRRSCDLQCGVLAGPEGTTIDGALSYTIGPITGTCDLDELSVCP